jgi:hypothetical protein
MIVEIESKVLREVLELAERDLPAEELPLLDDAWAMLEDAERAERARARGQVAAVTAVNRTEKTITTQNIPPRPRGRPVGWRKAATAPTKKPVDPNAPLVADNAQMYEDFNRKAATGAPVRR